MAHMRTQILLSIVQRWNLSVKPEYRGFRCAYCQTYLRNNAWHHFLQTDAFVCPIHFCDSCEQKFQNNQLTFDTPTSTIDRTTFGADYKYTPEAIKQFTELFATWRHSAPAVSKREIVCDACGMALEKTQNNQPQGFHVWWNNHGTLVEMHFDKQCGEKLSL